MDKEKGFVIDAIILTVESVICRGCERFLHLGCRFIKEGNHQKKTLFNSNLSPKHNPLTLSEISNLRDWYLVFSG